MAGNGIGADVQNLGIERLELFAPGIEFGHLRGSSGSPVEGMESENQVLLPEIIAQLDSNVFLARDRRECEWRSGISDV